VKVTGLKSMGIIETKGVITNLIQSSSDEEIVRALMTCLRLLEDESKRYYGE
jgi:hypothetical protein